MGTVSLPFQSLGFWVNCSYIKSKLEKNPQIVRIVPLNFNIKFTPENHDGGIAVAKYSLAGLELEFKNPTKGRNRYSCVA